MPVVADIPEEFEKALEAFRPHFGGPAFEHFKRYVLGLIVSENLTVEGINRIFIQAGHPSSLNRFLTAGIWKQHAVNDVGIDMLKTQGALGSKGWLAIDDTLTHKTGKKIEGVGIFWDHREKRYVWAHNIVTAEFVNPKGDSHPLDFRLYLKEEQGREKRVPFKTKIELAQELVEDALQRGLEIQGALFDNWFASKDFIKFLREKGLHWVTRLKSDRNVKIKGRYVAISEFAAILPRESFRRVQIGARIYQVFSKAVDLKGVGQVRILISYDNEEFSGSPAYFATDQIRWEGTRILKTYAMRWNIETFFRDSKQNLGLESYQLRDLRGIKRHWYLIFLAYSLQVSGLFGIAKKPRRESPPLGELISKTTGNVFSGLVAWITLQLNEGRNREDICRLAYGF
ncbi:MAG: IS701 family transposase [Desulfomonile sp.]|nr:IS701 family transposase [Desulfomonile sp.]